ncbi:radical SAM protein [Brevibacillus sp. SAFN-007a]|uniref:radical SAM protein n=1 Tax=Brevibacillus sp. SAFN-007a TaxID=3436862 RepID=UPI003F818E13
MEPSLKDLTSFDIGKKLWWHLDKVNKLVNDEQVWPIHFGIDPSNLCNHDCVWCSYTEVLPNKKMLEREVLLNAITSMSKNGTKAITWSGGGEPTTNPHLAEFFHHAYELGLQQALYTNGQLLNDHHIDAITKGFQFIRFSLDAGTDETYQKAHRVRPGTFHTVINNISKIVKRKIGTTVGVSVIVHETNYKDIVKAAELMRNLGVDYLEFKPVVFAEHQGGQQYSKDWWANEVYPLLDEAKTYSNNEFKVLVIGHKFDSIIMENFGRDYHCCLSHHLQGLINADGTLYVCCNQRGNENFKLGNLNENTLEEIWWGERRKNIISNINVQKCPPNCKGHEANKVLWHAKNPLQQFHPNFL